MESTSIRADELSWPIKVSRFGFLVNRMYVRVYGNRESELVSHISHELLSFEDLQNYEKSVDVYPACWPDYMGALNISNGDFTPFTPTVKKSESTGVVPHEGMVGAVGRFANLGRAFGQIKIVGLPPMYEDYNRVGWMDLSVPEPSRVYLFLEDDRVIVETPSTMRG